jgi:hypothetical protein
MSKQMHPLIWHGVSHSVSKEVSTTARLTRSHAETP